MAAESLNDETGEVTALLRAWRERAPGAEKGLLDLVYKELRRLAAVFLRSERADHTWQPSDLVHEAYLRLLDRRRTSWQDRRHFLSVAAQCMRRLLIEHARAKLRKKRGEGRPTVPLDLFEWVSESKAPELLALDDALTGLQKSDPFKARLVELRFFGGFTIPETADVLECSRATVERHWRLAQAWIYAEMRGP